MKFSQYKLTTSSSACPSSFFDFDLTYCSCDTDRSARSSSLVTPLLHLARSLASCSASSTVRPKILQSSLTLSSQRFLGLPTGLFPCTLPYNMMFGMRFGDIRTTCPKYESRLDRTWLTTSRLISRSLLMSTFLRRSHRLIPAIRLRLHLENK